MATQLSQGPVTPTTQGKGKLIYALTLLLIIVGALLVYKGTAALAVIEKVQNTGVWECLQ